ncbi:MAG TPA: 7-carboxy-7-deazaguanine synthase QueE [Limnochordia bacterium]|nr:7-carboxy-7-deazaguanine synthase QueE [Limnochordia bacterium]
MPSAVISSQPDAPLRTLRVAEIFTSIQGEGAQAGYPCTFIRFQGCSVGCSWCDTKYTWDFAGGKPYTIDELAAAPTTERVIFTGGEPVQQPRAPMLELVRALHARGRRIQVETSGRFFAPWLNEVDWRTVSPKPPSYRIDARLLPIADELKYVVDGEFDPKVVPPNTPAGCVISLQPEGNKPEFVAKALTWLFARTNWRLSVQLHKFLALP